VTERPLGRSLGQTSLNPLKTIVLIAPLAVKSTECEVAHKGESMKISRWLIVGAVIGAFLSVAAACDAETDKVNECEWEEVGNSRPAPAPVKMPTVKAPKVTVKTPTVTPPRGSKAPVKLPEIDVEYDCD
jgi:hypothetical protein